MSDSAPPSAPTGLLTLRQAARLSGIGEKRLRQYTVAEGKEEPRLRTVRFGEGKNRPHYTTREWLIECLASRNPGRRGRPGKPVPTDLMSSVCTSAQHADSDDAHRRSQGDATPTE
jgi:hypothetical protein